MATDPVFTNVPKLGVQQIATANTNRDGTGTVSSAIVTGATLGTRVNEVVVEATGTTTAGVVRIFVHDGAAFHLWDEILVTAITPSASVAAFRAIRRYDELILPSGYSLRASTHNAETFKVFVEGGDY